MRILGVVGLLLVLAGGWLVFDNPEVSLSASATAWYDGESTRTCLAPYDTVLNHADNFPGGEPPPGGDRIARDCRHAGRVRFAEAAGLGGVGVLLGALSLRGTRTRKSRGAQAQLAGP